MSFAASPSPALSPAVFTTGATPALSPASFQVPPPNTATRVFSQFGQGPNPNGIGTPITNPVQVPGPTLTPNGGLQMGTLPGGGAVPGALYPSLDNPGVYSTAPNSYSNGAPGSGFFSSLGTALGTTSGMLLAGLALIAIIELNRK